MMSLVAWMAARRKGTARYATDGNKTTMRVP
jgi:hypothetical protein